MEIHSRNFIIFMLMQACAQIILSLLYGYIFYELNRFSGGK